MDEVLETTLEAPETTLEQPPETPVPQPPTPAPTDFDYRSLYQDSTRARIAAETELERLKQEAIRRPLISNDPDVTDEDIGARPAESIRNIIKRELSAALGPVNEISNQFRTTNAMQRAEETVWAAYPNLAPHKEYLSQKVRAALQGARDIDASIYNVTLSAVIGEEAMRAYNPQLQPPTPASVITPGAPAPRATGSPPAPATGATPKLTEQERGAMKRAGYDPNKPADVKSFWAVVNNEDGVSV